MRVIHQKSVRVFAGYFLLVGLAAALLLKVRASYVLGAPGVKVVDAPIYDERGAPASPKSVYLPERVGDYLSTNQFVTRAELEMLPPDTLYGRRAYFAPGHSPLAISVVLMGTDRTSIHKPEFCLTGQGFSITQSEVIAIPMNRPRPYELKATKLTMSGRRYAGKGRYVPMSGLFIYWFVTDQHLTPHHGERMWLMGRDLISKGLLQRWAYVACYGLCQPGEENLLMERLKSFIMAAVPEFQTTTGQAARMDSGEPGNAVASLRK